MPVRQAIWVCIVSASPMPAEPAPQQGEALKAIVQDTYGPADVLEFRDIGKPEIAGGEVLVRVHAAGVDRACGTS